MSKYIIELGEDANMVQVISVTQSGNAYIDSTVYVGYLEQLNSDYINEHFGDLQDDAYKRGINDGSLDVKQRVEAAYQRGLEDAWEVAKKLFSTMAESDIERAFPIEWNSGGFNALINLQPQEAIEKLKAYEKKQSDKIKVGDEVFDIPTKTKGILLEPETEHLLATVIIPSQRWRTFNASHVNLKKTGKHYDIEKLLEAMEV